MGAPIRRCLVQFCSHGCLPSACEPADPRGLLQSQPWDRLYGALGDQYALEVHAVQGCAIGPVHTDARATSGGSRLARMSTSLASPVNPQRAATGARTFVACPDRVPLTPRLVRAGGWAGR